MGKRGRREPRGRGEGGRETGSTLGMAAPPGMWGVILSGIPPLLVSSVFFCPDDGIVWIGNKIGAKRTFLWWPQVGKRPGSSGREAEGGPPGDSQAHCWRVCFRQPLADARADGRCRPPLAVPPLSALPLGATPGRHKNTSGTFSGWLASHHLITRKRRWLSPPRPAFSGRPVNLACPQVASGAPLVNNNNQGWVHFVVNF